MLGRCLETGGQDNILYYQLCASSKISLMVPVEFDSINNHLSESFLCFSSYSRLTLTGLETWNWKKKLASNDWVKCLNLSIDQECIFIWRERAGQGYSYFSESSVPV